jgi:hypothetical protein
LRHGDFIRLFRHRYHSRRYYHFPENDGGRGDLWLLMLNTSLAAKESEKKMFCILDVWAPWMKAPERKRYVAHVLGLDLYQRIMTAREIGDALRLTNAEREQLNLWQFKPIDMTDKQLADQRRRKNNARRKARRNKTRAEYLASCLSATKPWEVHGICRRTWERRRVASHGRDNSRDAASTVATPMQVESQTGCHKADVPRDVVQKRGKVIDPERNASSSYALRPNLRQES